MLLLKLTLAPLLVAVATVAAQKWGPRVGGLLMGLPLTTGPIFLLLLFEQGPDFAAEATLGILFGLIGLTAFAVVYATVAAWTGWIGSIVSATIAFFAVSIGACSLGTHIAVAGIAAWCVPALALPLMRRPAFAMPHTNPPWWNLLVRMFAVAVLTLLATTMAMRLGAVFSGIVGTYPVAITVVIIFTHHQFGREPVTAMLRGCVLSWISFASCFVVIGLSLEVMGSALAIVLGALAAIVTSVLVLWMERSLTRVRIP
jgi:hypothetical protein